MGKNIGFFYDRSKAEQVEAAWDSHTASIQAVLKNEQPSEAVTAIELTWDRIRLDCFETATKMFIAGQEIDAMFLAQEIASNHGIDFEQSKIVARDIGTCVFTNITTTINYYDSSIVGLQALEIKRLFLPNQGEQ
jgi:protein-disulfide isomerase-like protein with CxxC motif